MELNDLREFLVLAQTGNYAEAADELFLSQSSLSRHIQRLEKELGVSLFDRTTRRVRISESGELLLPYARQIAELQSRYTADLQTRLSTKEGILILGSIPALLQYGIADVLVEFKKSCPRTAIHVIPHGGAEETKQMLGQGKCHLAFFRFGDQTDEDLVSIRYAVDTMVAVIPANHPLAKHSTISLPMLAKASFLLTPKETILHQLCIKACEQSGFEPTVTYTDHDLGNLCDLVIKGMGVAIMMKKSALSIYSLRIAIVDISPPVTSQVCLCYLKGTELSDAARQFVQCVERHALLGPGDRAAN